VHRSTAALSNPILPLLFSYFVLAISPLLRLSLLRVTLRSFPATKTPASLTFVQLEETQRHAPTGSSEQFAARYACAATKKQPTCSKQLPQKAKLPAYPVMAGIRQLRWRTDEVACRQVNHDDIEKKFSAQMCSFCNLAVFDFYR
jgi:hypothetical protein